MVRLAVFLDSGTFTVDFFLPVPLLAAVPTALLPPAVFPLCVADTVLQFSGRVVFFAAVCLFSLLL